MPEKEHGDETTTPLAPSQRDLLDERGTGAAVEARAKQPWWREENAMLALKQRGWFVGCTMEHEIDIRTLLKHERGRIGLLLKKNPDICQMLNSTEDGAAFAREVEEDDQNGFERTDTLKLELRQLNQDKVSLEAEVSRYKQKSLAVMQRSTSLATKMQAQIKANQALGEKHASLETVLETRTKERDDAVKDSEQGLLKMATLSSGNEKLEEKIREHDDILSTSIQECQDEIRAAKTHLEDETKRFEAARNAFDRERGTYASEVARLESENTAIRELIGVFAHLPETSQQALRSITNLEIVLEECIVCSEVLLSGIGTTSFGVMSYSCACSRVGHTRTIHVNCVVSMENLKCPHCSEEIVLIAPLLMTQTAVRNFTVRKS